MLMARGTVLVTGGAKRIGRAISLRLAADGYSVAVHHRGSEEEAAEVVERIRSAGGTAVAVQADFSDAEAAASLVSQASSLGPLCGLVNNASLFVHDDIDTIDSEGWDAHMDVNAKSPVLLIRSLNQHIGEDGANGGFDLGVAFGKQSVRPSIGDVRGCVRGWGCIRQ